MATADTLDTLRSFITRDLHWTGDVSVLTADYPLIQNHVIDSLGLLLLVSFLEDELKVVVADEDLVPDNFATLGNIVALIEAKQRPEEERTG